MHWHSKLHQGSWNFSGCAIGRMVKWRTLRPTGQSGILVLSAGLFPMFKFFKKASVALSTKYRSIQYLGRTQRLHTFIFPILLTKVIKAVEIGLAGLSSTLRWLIVWNNDHIFIELPIHGRLFIVRLRCFDSQVVRNQRVLVRTTRMAIPFRKTARYQ